MSTSDATPDGGGERPFRFDVTSGELTGPTGTTRLAPQPSSLLTLFMERRGEVVGRDEIKELLWPAGGVDVDQGIAFALREIRKGLHEAGCDPGLVETIPRRGYRLQAAASGDPGRGSPDADFGNGSTVDQEPSDVGTGHETGDGAPDAAARRWKRIALGAVAVVLAGVLSILLPSPRETPVIAIVGHEPEVLALAGVADALGTTLTTVLTDSLEGVAGIVGPTGTGELEGPDDVEGARRLFDACIVVSGNVAPEGGDSVVVFTQMVGTVDRIHLWARLDTVPAAGAVERVVPGILEGAREALGGC